MSNNVNKDIQNAARAANVFTETEKNTSEKVRKNHMNTKNEEKLKVLLSLIEEADPSVINWMTNIYIVGFKRGVSEGQKLSGFSAEEVCSILVEVGQKSGKFKLGDWIKFTPSEVYEILKEYGSNIENGFN